MEDGETTTLHQYQSSEINNLNSSENCSESIDILSIIN